MVLWGLKVEKRLGLADVFLAGERVSRQQPVKDKIRAHLAVVQTRGQLA